MNRSEPTYETREELEEALGEVPLIFEYSCKYSFEYVGETEEYGEIRVICAGKSNNIYPEKFNREENISTLGCLNTVYTRDENRTRNILFESSNW